MDSGWQAGGFGERRLAVVRAGGSGKRRQAVVLDGVVVLFLVVFLMSAIFETSQLKCVAHCANIVSIIMICCLSMRFA